MSAVSILGAAPYHPGEQAYSGQMSFPYFQAYHIVFHQTVGKLCFYGLFVLRNRLVFVGLKAGLVDYLIGIDTTY